MRALVTGATGFLGRYLQAILLEKGFEVYGTYIDSNEGFMKGVEPLECDVVNPEEVDKCLHKVQPDRIYHLAAQSYPIVSWSKPHLTLTTNVIGTLNLLEGVRRTNGDPTILVACSAAEYGVIRPEDTPVKESQPLLPLNPYGVSKVAQDLLSYQYHKSYALKTIRARIFNTTGPGKIMDVCSDLTKRAVLSELGRLKPPLPVGNVEARRDITDVRDGVEALYLLMEKGGEGEVYNVCGSKTYSVGEIINLVKAQARVAIEFVSDETLLRPTDEPIIWGDNRKLRETTGWSPKIHISRTIDDMLEYWRTSLRESG